MNEQRQVDQLEPIYNSSVPIQDFALKTSRERWTIEKGGEKGSGRSALRRDMMMMMMIYRMMLLVFISEPWAPQVV